MKILKLAFLAIIVLIATNTSAQTLSVSPFHHLPKAESYKKLTLGLGTAVSKNVTAWRFTAAAAGYDIINNKLLTGIGYGWNTMHVNTATDGSTSWYTDFTANISIYAAGNVAPTYSYGNTNVIAFGPSVGILNKLINIGYVYYPATNGNKSQSGVIANVSIPLN